MHRRIFVSFFVCFVVLAAIVVCNDSDESAGKSQSHRSSKKTEMADAQSSSSIPKSVKGSFTDSRDNRTYKTVTIGTQTWMAQNLNYEMDGSFCYDDLESNCTQYGRLYTWSDAIDACPTGWHLPSYKEWNTLIEAVGGSRSAGKILKSVDGWKDLKGNDFGNGTDDIGFTALPAGYLSNHSVISGRVIHGLKYKMKNNQTKFWSLIDFIKLEHSVVIIGGFYSNWSWSYLPHAYDEVKWDDDAKALSVRCVKDEAKQERKAVVQKQENEKSFVPFVSPSDVVKGTFKDERDGQTYKTVTIGNQTWMAENINYEIGYSSCLDDSVSNCAKYGRLYQWRDAMDACPVGWRLPLKADWDTLIASVGGKSMAGKLLRSTSGWQGNELYGSFVETIYINGTDDYSFSVLPYGLDEAISFWSGSEFGKFRAYAMSFPAVRENAYIGEMLKSSAYSVRCIKNKRNDSAVQSRVEGTMTDSRDGKSYKTVTIDGRTWMAENLNYEMPNSNCYNGKEKNCAKYGRLYAWNAAKDACPAGYHLPTQTEWDELFYSVGGRFGAGNVLRSTSGWKADKWWRWSDNGTDDFGFTVLPAGYRDTIYKEKGYRAYFWSSSKEKYLNQDCFRRGPGYTARAFICKDNWIQSVHSVFLHDTAAYWRKTILGKNESQEYSIRCVKDVEKSVVSHSACSECVERVAKSDSSRNKDSGSKAGMTEKSTSYSFMTDPRDKRTYKTVKIGKQTWMAENLNYKIENSSCYNDSARYCAKYGRLYTWEAAMNACPTGYHLPKLVDWMVLVHEVGLSSAGKKLKSVSGWKDVKGNDFDNGTDEFGFSALPAGERHMNHSSNSGKKREKEESSFEGSFAYFWSSTMYDRSQVYSMIFGDKYESFYCETRRKRQRFSISKLTSQLRTTNIYYYKMFSSRFNRCFPEEYDSVFWERYEPDMKFSVRCVKDEISRK